MAAHVYRALLMTFGETGDISEQAKLLEHGIGYAPAFAYLEYGDYEKIANWCSKVALEENPGYLFREELHGILMDILPFYGQRWIDLGKPCTSEEWGRAKYGGDDG